MDIGFAYLLHHKLLQKEKNKSIELISKEKKETKYIVCERCGQSYLWCNCSIILKNRDNTFHKIKSYKDLQ